MLCLLAVTPFGTARAGTGACNLGGKKIAYDLQFCVEGKCFDEFGQISFATDKVLFHRALGSDQVAVAHLGQTTELPPEEVKAFLREESLDPSRLMIVKDVGQIMVGYSNAQLEATIDYAEEIYSRGLQAYIAGTSKKTVRISVTDCGTCFVTDATFRVEMDGEVQSDLRLKHSSMCIMQDTGR